MIISVVALGKIGLPLAVRFAEAGHRVIGVDVQKRVVDLVNSGLEPFPGEAELAQKLRECVESGRLEATTDYGLAIPQSDVIVVVVPVAVDESTGEPDFRLMEAATRSFASHLGPDTLICYETTLPVGTTRQRWRPLIEQISGLREGQDFHLAYSPERVLTGRVFADLRRYPKLVGGLSREGGDRAVRFYREVLEFDERCDLPQENGVWDLGSAEAAEMAKLVETTYRDVNIALANQFALFASRAGIDFYRIIDACNSQPYSHIHRPGIAVGGHCIPVYPRLYLAVDPEATVVRAARLANAEMPWHATALLADLVGDMTGMKAVVLGAAYRGRVKETAFSGVHATIQALQDRGASIRVHDPFYTDEELRSHGWDPYHLGDQVDIAVVQADHSEYAILEPSDLPGVRVLLDGRNITEPALWAGVPRIVIGGGGNGAISDQVLDEVSESNTTLDVRLPE